ncbi:hypothetical protein INT45_014325 [Circinella minor]|uniref:SWIM-type domain-containing protein n=1 Tax=Circinella minor TaxID=1195481 RepID=A0A8H7RQY3_9FUNG|nr:hypothetical protein INT45_014325 [Circinella minor]
MEIHSLLMLILAVVPPATKNRRTNLSKHTGCTMHDGHNPFSEQDIKESRLPFDVKNWIEKHVEEKKDWRGMKDLLQLSNEKMDEFKNEINIDPNVLKIPAALRVHRHDIVVNQIQQRLNNISRKHRFDKQSTQAWINILKERGYDTLFEIINTSEPDEKANRSKKELLMVASDITNKGCPVAFFITNSESSFTISCWLSWLKFECGFYPKRIMIDCSVTEMDAILSMFGTKVQVLVCHWHIRRAWEKKVKEIKSSISTADSKALRKKACVYLSSLMYAKNPEEFDTIYITSLSWVRRCELNERRKKRHQREYELDDDTAAEYISIVDAQKICVKSFKKENIYYEIAVREGVLHSCTCPDFYFNHILCKHNFLCNRVYDIPLHHVGISRSAQPIRPINEADNDKIEEMRL